MYNPEKFTPATLEFVDIAGLVKGASKGEGLGNKFLADIREVDAIVHVVRCFEDIDIIHVDGEINPARDIETINLELIFSDIEMIERRIDRSRKLAKGDKRYISEIDFLERLKGHLESGKSARAFDYTDDERDIIKSTPLLSGKPVIYAANLCEEDFINNIENNENYNMVKKLPKRSIRQYSLYAHRLKRKSRIWSRKTRLCFGRDGLEGIGTQPYYKGRICAAGPYFISYCGEA